MNKSYWKNCRWSWSTRRLCRVFSRCSGGIIIWAGSSRWASGFITWRFWRGQWLALLVFCAAAKHLRHREKWIGWTEAQRRKRLGLVTNNARFLILPHGHYPNLATRVMGLCLKRLPQDWQARYAHPVWLAESFVDTQLFRGTAYKASGWTELGPTQGYGRSQQDYYVKHDRPKALFVKELKPNARRSLCADHLPPRWRWWWKARCRCCRRCAWGNCARYALILPRCRTFADGWKAIR